ncbi:transposase [Peribacillus cavernae]|nr:transposase [Peribacillus cavernae]
MINKTIGCCRFVCNQALAKQNEKIGFWFVVQEMVQNGQLTENRWKSDFFHASNAQKELTSMLNEVDSTALKSTLQDLGKAFKEFYHKSKGKPRFKSKKNKTQSYKAKCNYNKGIGTVRMKRIEKKDFLLLPNIGWVKVAKSREVRGKILSATVRKSATGKYFVSILTEQEIETVQDSMFEIGIDLGLKEFATFSDGATISNPKWFRSLEEKLVKAQRILSRRKMGSSMERALGCRIKCPVDIERDSLLSANYRSPHQNRCW